MTKHDLIRQTLSLSKGLRGDFYTLDLRLTLLKFAANALTIRECADFGNHSGIVLEKVAEYFYYYWRNRDAIDVPDMDIPPELCLELLMAADYLGLDF